MWFAGKYCFSPVISIFRSSCDNSVHISIGSECSNVCNQKLRTSADKDKRITFCSTPETSPSAYASDPRQSCIMWFHKSLLENYCSECFSCSSLEILEYLSVCTLILFPSVNRTLIQSSSLCDHRACRWQKVEDSKL